MSDPSAFNKEIKQLTSVLMEEIDAGVRQVALVIDQSVVLATPVDTGRARSNWTASIDAPAEGTREPYSPAKGLGPGESANANAAISQAKSVIPTYKGGRNSSIHITNNLPYIEPLNDGSSAQAPAGFVEKAVQAGEEAVARIVVLKK